MPEVHIIPVRMTCGICGKEYEDYAINRHISQPIVCGDCYKRYLGDIEIKGKTMTSCCDTCSHCCYVHEYGVYFCRVADVCVELHDEACENYEGYIEIEDEYY